MCMRVQFHGHRAMNLLQICICTAFEYIRINFSPSHSFISSHIWIQIGCHRCCWQENRHNHSIGTALFLSCVWRIRSARVHTIWLWRSGYSQMQCFDNNDKFIPTYSFPAIKQTYKQAYLSASTWSFYRQRHDIISTQAKLLCTQMASNI